MESLSARDLILDVVTSIPGLEVIATLAPDPAAPLAFVADIQYQGAPYSLHLSHNSSTGVKRVAVFTEYSSKILSTQAALELISELNAQQHVRGSCKVSYSWIEESTLGIVLEGEQILLAEELHFLFSQLQAVTEKLMALEAKIKTALRYTAVLLALNR